ncbi:MAG: response regulator [Polyangiaceae bacterium]|nr:response regulator [Polyangiaceae bacterium]
MGAPILHQIIASDAMGMLLGDPSGRILDASDSFLALVGYTREDLEQGHINDGALTAPEHGHKDREAAVELRRTGRHHPFEKDLVRKDGTRVPVLVSTSYLGGPEQLCLRFIHNLTERRRSDEAQRRSAELEAERAMLIAELREADQRKDELLTMLAHELRNPLGPIRNATQALRQSGPKGELVERLRDVIDRQTTHMARLIDDLLDVSRITRGKIMLQRDLVELNELVKNIVYDYRNELESSQIEISLSLPDESLWIHGDGTRIAQCAGNLLINAQKFSKKGGRIHIELRADGEMSVLSVEDDGMGIEPELLDRVFLPFTQATQNLDRSGGGLGMGLALVKGLIELHGGTVHAESKGRNQGAIFTLRLPRAPAPTRREEPPLISPAEKRRIVIIEDNADAAESLSLLLSMGGHDVSTAATGPDGIDLVRIERPDVVICDIGLPGGVTGYDVARAIRAWGKKCTPYLIALTGYGRDEDRKRAADAGFDVHLTKPIAPSALELLIAEWTTKIDKQPESGRLG